MSSRASHGRLLTSSFTRTARCTVLPSLRAADGLPLRAARCPPGHRPSHVHHYHACASRAATGVYIRMKSTSSAVSTNPVLIICQFSSKRHLAANSTTLSQVIAKSRLKTLEVQFQVRYMEKGNIPRCLIKSEAETRSQATGGILRPRRRSGVGCRWPPSTRSVQGRNARTRPI